MMLYTLTLFLCIAMEKGECRSLTVDLANFPSEKACQHAGANLPWKPKSPMDPVMGFVCKPTVITIK